jgi:hypothetical protein
MNRHSAQEAQAMGSSRGGGKPPAWEFHATGPRNLSNPSWRDLIRSNWFAALLLFPSPSPPLEG